MTAIVRAHVAHTPRSPFEHGVGDLTPVRVAGELVWHHRVLSGRTG